MSGEGLQDRLARLKAETRRIENELAGVGINIAAPVPVELHRQLKARAAADGVTQADIIRAALSAYFTEKS